MHMAHALDGTAMSAPNNNATNLGDGMVVFPYGSQLQPYHHPLGGASTEMHGWGRVHLSL